MVIMTTRFIRYPSLGNVIRSVAMCKRPEVMTLRYVRQLTKRGCGAACIAMICDLSFHLGVAAVGTDKATRYAHLRSGLRAHGWRWGPVKQLVRGGRPIEGMAIVLWRTDGVKIGHWTVLIDGTFWDPARGIRQREDYPAHTRPVSYMPVYRGGDPGGETPSGRPVGRRPPAHSTLGPGGSWPGAD
jgi:hypothetical protein